MNERILFESMNAIDDEILLRSEETENTNHSVSHSYKKTSRRLSVILIAAALTVLLAGAGLAAVLYGDNIQNWFAHYWQLVTGQEMSEKQTVLIDHLSQDIGVSQTVDGITVTVDSATVGMDHFFLLLRVEGMKLSDRYNYGFHQLDMTVSPDPIEELGGMGSYGFQFHGLDGDGAALMLIDYDYVTKKGYVEDNRPLDITVTLGDFCRNPHVNGRKVLAEGTWQFSFTLERNQMPQQLTLPDTEIMVIDLTNREQYTEVPAMITDIVLTNTGLQFCYDYQEGTLDFGGRVKVYLKTGESIGASGGTGVPLEDGGLLYCSYKWMVPVDLDEVAAVQISETLIEVQ